MEKNKIKLEIYEGDPFGSACCGPGPLVTSEAAVEQLRQMLTERYQIVEKLSKDFKDIAQVQREIVSQKRWDYSRYVRKLMSDGKPLPYVFVNGEAVVVGRFPSYEEFVTLLKSFLQKPQKFKEKGEILRGRRIQMIREVEKWKYSKEDWNNLNGDKCTVLDTV